MLLEFLPLASNFLVLMKAKKKSENDRWYLSNGSIFYQKIR